MPLTKLQRRGNRAASRGEAGSAQARTAGGQGGGTGQRRPRGSAALALPVHLLRRLRTRRGVGASACGQQVDPACAISCSPSLGARAFAMDGIATQLAAMNTTGGAFKVEPRMGTPARSLFLPVVLS